MECGISWEARTDLAELNSVCSMMFRVRVILTATAEPTSPFIVGQTEFGICCVQIKVLLLHNLASAKIFRLNRRLFHSNFSEFSNDF